MAFLRRGIEGRSYFLNAFEIVFFGFVIHVGEEKIFIWGFK